MKNVLPILYAMLLSTAIIHSQETEQKHSNDPKSGNVHIKVKEVSEQAKPDIYVDGKKFDFELDLLDQSKIESVEILKGKQAMEKYNAPNGVVLVKTKRKIQSTDPKTVIGSTTSDYRENAPLVIIDGKVSTREALNTLSPDNIKEMRIFKDEQAIEKYNAPNGAVVITTKKEK